MDLNKVFLIGRLTDNPSCAPPILARKFAPCAWQPTGHGKTKQVSASRKPNTIRWCSGEDWPKSLPSTCRKETWCTLKEGSERVHGTRQTEPKSIVQKLSRNECSLGPNQWEEQEEEKYKKSRK